MTQQSPAPSSRRTLWAAIKSDWHGLTTWVGWFNRIRVLSWATISLLTLRCSDWSAQRMLTILQSDPRFKAREAETRQRLTQVLSDLQSSVASNWAAKAPPNYPSA